MAFVGPEVHLDVADDVLVVDLLLFHVTQLRYVVVELKIGRLSPAYVGQLLPRLRRTARHLRRRRRRLRP
nr:PDDEXK nuclease domain-containing protein [Georgenia soli]